MAFAKLPDVRWAYVGQIGGHMGNLTSLSPDDRAHTGVQQFAFGVESASVSAMGDGHGQKPLAGGANVG